MGKKGRTKEIAEMKMEKWHKKWKKEGKRIRGWLFSEKVFSCFVQFVCRFEQAIKSRLQKKIVWFFGVPNDSRIMVLKGYKNNSFNKLTWCNLFLALFGTIISSVCLFSFLFVCTWVQYQKENHKTRTWLEKNQVYQLSCLKKVPKLVLLFRENCKKLFSLFLICGYKKQPKMAVCTQFQNFQIRGKQSRTEILAFEAISSLKRFSHKSIGKFYCRPQKLHLQKSLNWVNSSNFEMNAKLICPLMFYWKLKMKFLLVWCSCEAKCSLKRENIACNHYVMIHHHKQIKKFCKICFHIP